MKTMAMKGGSTGLPVWLLDQKTDLSGRPLLLLFINLIIFDRRNLWFRRR